MTGLTTLKFATYGPVKLELIEHIPRVPWCIVSATESATDGFQIRLIEHAQDSLVQACAVVTLRACARGKVIGSVRLSVCLSVCQHKNRQI
jgi:hypothetical protein